jgi:hypothetical protein
MTGNVILRSKGAFPKGTIVTASRVFAKLEIM